MSEIQPHCLTPNRPGTVTKETGAPVRVRDARPDAQYRWRAADELETAQRIGVLEASDPETGRELGSLAQQPPLVLQSSLELLRMASGTTLGHRRRRKREKA
jgi:hypothetical protein